jgi:hypothetical protein
MCVLMVVPSYVVYVTHLTNVTYLTYMTYMTFMTYLTRPPLLTYFVITNCYDRTLSRYPGI